MFLAGLPRFLLTGWIGRSSSSSPSYSRAVVPSVGIVTLVGENALAPGLGENVPAPGLMENALARLEDFVADPNSLLRLVFVGVTVGRGTCCIIPPLAIVVILFYSSAFTIA